MNINSPLGALLFFLIVVVIAVPLFRRLKLGAILGYLVAGLIIGPGGVDIVSNPNDILHFSEIGVVLLLFVIGLELSPDTLWDMRRHIAGLGAAQLVFSAMLVGGVVFIFYQSAQSALIIGLALALSSTAFAIQLMAEKGILASRGGRRGFAILLMQDLAVIPVLLLVESFSTVASEQTKPWWYGVLAIVMLLFAGRFLLNYLLKIVSRYGSRESMTALSLLIVVGAAFLMDAAGLSMGMGAFVAGIMLANSSFRHQIESDIEPFKGLTLGLFFIAIGMTLNIELFLQQPILLLLVALALMITKCVIIAALLRFVDIDWRQGLQLGLMLSQGGEFAFVVMAQAVDGGSLSSELAQQVNLVVGLSMALTSPLVGIISLCKRAESNNNETISTPEFHASPEVMILGFGRFGQATGRILAANGIPFIALDKDAEHIDFIKQFGNQVFFGEASRLDVLHAAGIDKVKVVLVATNDTKITENITKLIVQHFPNIKVIARARNRSAYWALRSLGAHHVIRELFKGSVEAASSTLNALGFSVGEALKKVDEFESHDSAMMEYSYEHRDDLDKLIEIGRKGRSDLERLFRQDQMRE
ncbi:monovalent cation:proton antiporter-2 (CPA2) family protein [Aliikangiella sp. IMCC44359]|uniref:monovalent cation:proton antiporter-2 (CPA2) family protein n=1 Tax=Aliikangiella sp. IMCC44359 TaxID=3459125 RepID=UPI00403ABBC6